MAVGKEPGAVWYDNDTIMNSPVVEPTAEEVHAVRLVACEYTLRRSEGCTVVRELLDALGVGHG